MKTLIAGAPNFSIEELTRSETAARKGLKNTPDNDAILNLEYLAQTLLQPIRDYFGEPLVVTSGFRTTAVNTAVGGAYGSFHRFGMAADVRFEKKSSRKLVELFSYVYTSLPFTELIAEELPDGWVHVAIQRGRENERQLKYKLRGQGVIKATYSEVLRVLGEQGEL